MANVKIVSKKTHEILLEGQKDSLTLLEPSVVLLQVDIKDVNRIEKDGRNVKVTLKSGEVIIISDFFDSNGSGDSSKNTLAFENKDHTLSWINYIDNHGAVVEGVNYSYVDDIEIFLYHDNSVSPWLWAALPAAGATVAIASNSDSKHHSGNDNSPTIPDDKIPTPSIHLKQNEDGSISISGKTIPNGKIFITDSKGGLHTGTANTDGSYKIEIPKDKVVDGEYSVRVMDDANNSSDNVRVKSPTADLSHDGTEVTGKALPGGTVIIKDDTGKLLGSGVADSEGNYKITITPAQTNGENLNVSVQDVSGNISADNNITAADTTPPLLPKDVTVTGNDDGSLNITGNTEPGADVTVTLPDGSTITGKADENGNIDIKVPSPAAEGDYSVVVKDQAGNESPVSDVTYSDSVAPAAPKDVTVTGNDDGSLNITGNTEPGADVTVTLPDGSTITGKADENGNIDIKVPSPAAEGDYSVVVKDQAGNESPVSDVTYSDSVAPAAPKDVTVTGNDDGSLNITGNTEPGADVTVTLPDGSTITGKADENGNIDIKVPSPAAEGDYSVVVKDQAGNESPVSDVTYSDSVAPAAPKDVTVTGNDDGSLNITGNTEPGADVTVTLPDGSTITGKADENGNIDIKVPSPAAEGDYSVVVKDQAGNESPVSDVTYSDSVAPAAPKDVTVTGNDDGSLNITGNTEPGADVTVTLPDGSTITGKADENGNIDIKVPSPAAEGDYSVVVKDQAGNESPVSDVTYSDSVAPAAPKDVTVTGNDDGSLNITGNTEPGADVTVTLPDGSTITGKADENGNIDIKVPSPAAEGDYSVVVKDQAGNESPVSDVTYSDSVAPAAPKDVTVTGNDDGSLNITGNTEPGADVTVTLPDGSTITGKADENGNIDIKVPSPAAEGDYSVVVKDQAGNESPVSDVTYSDSVAPAAPKDVTVTGNDDGSLNITGNTEPGADVTVTLPDGSTITGKADENGNIDIKVPSPAAEGDYSVVVKDQAGNESPVSDVTYSDSVAPAAPKDVTVTGNDDGSLNITGNTEPGADVTVTLPDGSTITGKADENGNIDIKVPSPAAEGDYSVVVKDQAGNESPVSDVTYSDSVAPAAPKDVTVTGNDDGSLNITGNTEPGADVTVTLPDGSTITGKADENGNIDIKVPSPAAEGDYSVVVKDQAGNESPVSDVTYSDSVAPAAPKDVTVTGNDDGSLNITGNTEPGADVTVTLPDGSTITGKADENGNIDIKVPSPAAEGDYSVVVKDQAGNESPVSDVTYSDSVAPAAPKDVTVTGNDDGSLNITGNTEPGADVTVTLPDGSTITGKADENGNIDIKVPSPAAEGDYSVVVKDQAGNESPVSDVTYSDSVAPAAPKDVTVTGNDDGSLNITGNTEPGADVTVTLPDGSTITGKADENGNIDIKVPSPAAEGDYSVVVKDQAGNESPVSDVTYSDSVAPAAPKDVTVTGNDDGSLNITGNTEPGADVTVTLPDGSTITGKADENGNIDIKVPSPAAEGDYSVVVKDQAGNESPVSDVTYSDSVAPAAPKDVTVTGNDDGSLNITGNTEPGADVTVTLPDGSTITGKADENGNIDIKVPSPAAEGDYSVVVKDQAGNESPVSDVTYSDSVAPAAPKDVTVTGNDDGSLNITGNTEPGADVTVTLPDGSTITGKADENGNIDIKVPSPAAEGDYSVVVKDQAGNESPVSDVTYSDSVAPAAPKDVTVTGNDDGSLNITGNTEPGADVTVTLPDGSTITGKADENGNIDIKVPSPAAEGDYSVVVKDQAGNESPVSDVTYSDSVAPAAPKDVTVTGNDDGSLNITGNTEPGADVTVTLPDGSTITGKADENGNIDIKVPSPAAEGDYSVVVKDQAGNESPVSDVTYSDIIAPVAPTANINHAGTEVTGTAEAGSMVIVRDAENNIVGQIIAGNDGTYKVTLSPAVNNGEELVVTATDSAGNVSSETEITAPDITPPAAIIDIVSISDDTGISDSDFITSDTSLTINGKLTGTH
ncbi:Ig-like domain-containing protein [Acinetobacter ursingii]|uniref:Ig-like domain-containing protein n=10 Tax=Acinetobacter ursingii TaxID=108980 RepID=A0AA46P463_9GAMM|nr:Ig-like domain-containing protein [Acinetobacter ursingii]UYF75246.1 Ig-like domain-containing protein [Acinetobacter ursingii]